MSRLTGIPRSTIRDWRRRAVSADDESTTLTGRRPTTCPICSTEADLDREAYAYLLGLYLGDGHIASLQRDVFNLRIVLDEDYPNIVGECAKAMEAVKGDGASPLLVQRSGCVSVQLGWKHWRCLFPQHGRGPKHKRSIVLAPWQREIVEAFPHLLLRGLIHSDGWRGTNRVSVRGRSYAYPRYQFVNFSDDIRGIFCWACDLYGVGWRRMRWNCISVARRADVARLDEVIGEKS